MKDSTRVILAFILALVCTAGIFLAGLLGSQELKETIIGVVLLIVGIVLFVEIVKIFRSLFKK